jgi:hypothetical protein
MKYYKTRICSSCLKELFYSCRASYWLANKNNARCRSCATTDYDNRKNNVEILLNENLESYYWLGFILADGHISKDYRLVVTLSNKDKLHLLKLANYINTIVRSTKNDTHCTIATMNKKSNLLLCNKFDINNNKTYNPPKLEIFNNLNREQLISVFAGFIDGDGSIKNLHKRKDFALHIKCHSSWINILKIFSNNFLKDCSVIINNAGYSLLTCGNSIILKDLKRELLKLNLPLMNRKWDKINLDFISRQELSKDRVEIIKERLLQKTKHKDIAAELGITRSGLFGLIKRNKLK